MSTRENIRLIARAPYLLHNTLIFKNEHPFTNCKVKIIAYADPDCCFKVR